MNRTATKTALVALYAALFTALALAATGGGHFNLPGRLALFPVPVMLTWPSLAFLASRSLSEYRRVAFICLLCAPGVGLMQYYLDSESMMADRYWFERGAKLEGFIAFQGAVAAAWLLPQCYFSWCLLKRPSATPGEAAAQKPQ